MKKRNWKFILPPPVLAAFLFMACNLIQEMPKDFVETYGNIAYVESVEYVGLAEEGGDKPKVTETKNFKIIYHIKNDGDFDLSPEFSFEGCEIKNPHVDTGKKRVSLTIAGEELKALDNGKEFKVKLTLYKASQKVLQSSYEIGMRYVYTGGPETPKGTVEIKIPLSLPEGYELSVKDSTEFKAEKGEDGSWIITTIGSGVAEGKYELELVVKDEEGKEIGTIKKEIEVSAGNPTNDFTEKDDEKSLDEFIDEVEKKIDEIEKNPPKNPDDDDKGDDDKGGETKPETPLGKVEITIPVHGGYTLEIDGENKDKFEVVPNGDGSYTITTKEEGGVPTGKYELELVVKDEDENEVKSFNKTVEVSTEEPAGNFAGDDEPFEITEEMIEKTTVYVRGKDAAWYDVKHPDDAKASDDNSGARLKPFATIQKAVDTIIARNADDDSEPYTIYVDGTLTQNEAPSGNKKGMADFSELEKGLKLTIKSLSDTKATLDANKKSRVIYANPTSGKLKLTLENLVITDGNVLDYGGGISFISNGGTLEIKNSEISKNTAPRDGGGVHISGNSTFKMNGCTISENIANGENIGNGAGIYVENGVNATISNTTISGNKAESNGGAIYAANNCNLTTENCTISGNSASGSSVTKGGGVYVTGSTFTMTGGTISGGNAKLGGGVFINSGKFIMNDGTTHEGSITRNIASQNGGGVYVGGGTFEMNGGKISSNKSKVEGKADSNGGGVYVYAGGTFTMSGGNIGGNTATKDGGGVYVTGGTSKFTMTGGTISGNTATNNGGGVYVAGGTLTMSGGKIVDKNKAKYGGGVYVITDDANAFMMSNGEISNNEASEDGGGVYVTGSTSKFTMTGGKIGDENTAQNGGGVYVNGGAFNMSGSASAISGNKAIKGDAEYNAQGGGIYLNGATFTMSGGTVSENKAVGNPTYSSSGGGIYVYESTFTMKGGTFSGNKAENGKGHGAFISPDNGILKMSGAAQFAESDDVYLHVYTGATLPTITVAGSLSAASPVATITLPDSAYAAGTQVLSVDAGVTMDETLCNKLFSITPDNGTKWKISYNNSSRKGVLKQDNVSTGDGGISVTLPDLGTYTFVVKSNGTQIVDNGEIISGNTMQLFEAYGNEKKLTETDGTFTLEIRDEFGKKWEGVDTSDTGLCRDVKVPTVPVQIAAQVYVKLVLNDGNVIEKPIRVTIEPKPNS